MALKVGDLYVLLSAKTSSYGKAMESAAKLTERIATRIKRAATEIGKIGALMGAGIGAALAIAAKHNADVAAEVQRSKDVFATFANEVAQMMLPALREMNQHLRELLGWWQSLSPQTKEQIGHWVAIATGVGLAALAFGKLAGLVAAVAQAMGVIGTVLTAINAPLLVVVVGIAAVVAALLVLHRAWRQNWGGIREFTAGVIEGIVGYWQAFKNWLSTSFFDWFIDKWAAIEKAIAKAGNFLKTHGGMTGNLGQMNAASDANVDRWAQSMKGGAVGEAFTLAKEKAQELATEGLSELKMAIGEAADWVKNKLGITGATGTVSSAVAKTKDHLTNGGLMADAHVQGYYENLYGSSSVEDLTRSGSRLGEDDEQGRTTAATAEAYRQEVEMRGYWNEQLSKLGAHLGAAAMSITSKLGDLGQVINSAVSGFQSGGWIGALVAVVMELLSRFERFSEIMNTGNGQMMMIMDQLKPGLNALVDGLKEFMGASGVMTEVIMSILNPVLKIIAKVLKLLSPLIEVVATALSGLAPLFEMLDAVLTPVFEVIGYILRFVGLTILGTMNGLLMLWQGILIAVYEIVKIFSASAAAEIGKQIVSNMLKIDDVQSQMKNLFETGSTGLGSKAQQTAEQLGKLGDTAERVSEELSNMPQGFKIELARMNATQAVSSSTAQFGSIQAEMERDAFRVTGNARKAYSFRRGGE